MIIENYTTCVATELDAMIQIYNKHMIPRCIDHLNKNQQKGPASLTRHFQQFATVFDDLLQAKEKMDVWKEIGVKDVQLAQKVRDYLW